MRWDTQLYSQKHHFVFQYGLELLDLMQPLPGERILDLGCGTGQLTNRIAESGAVPTGLDFSEDMVKQARLNYPGLSFFQGDARDFQVQLPFDAIFSNAVLHWIPEQKKVLHCIWNALKPGGRLVAELGGKGNIKAILGALEQAFGRHGFAFPGIADLWYYPSPGEYAVLLEEQGFQVRVLTHFDRETLLDDPENGISDWLDMFGQGFFRDLTGGQQRMIKLEVQDLLRPSHFREGRWYADYKRLRVVALKP